MIILSSDKKIWEHGKKLIDIDPLFFNSIEGVPQLKLERPPGTLRVRVD
jgi:hypothetical protein